MKNLDKYITNKDDQLDFFNKNGFFKVKNFLSKEKCIKIIQKLNKIKDKRKGKKLFVGDKNIEVLFNFFHEDLSLLKLIINPTIDKFLKKLFDEHYVLQINSARNVNFFSSNIKKSAGYKWHKDNRFINKKSMNPCVLHSIILCLDEFNKYNGSTEYIPLSHKSFSFFSRRQNNNYSKKILANRGDLIFLHGNLIHRTGKNKLPNSTRWSIFAFYTPWWVKPAINYKKYMKRVSKKLTDNEKKILHFNSTPPEKKLDINFFDTCFSLIIDRKQPNNNSQARVNGE